MSPQIINQASIVIIQGFSFHVITAVDENGSFWARDDQGKDYHFDVRDVEEVKF